MTLIGSNRKDSEKSDVNGRPLIYNPFSLYLSHLILSQYLIAEIRAGLLLGVGYLYSVGKSYYPSAPYQHNICQKMCHFLTMLVTMCYQMHLFINYLKLFIWILCHS